MGDNYVTHPINESNIGEKKMQEFFNDGHQGIPNPNTVPSAPWAYVANTTMSDQNPDMYLGNVRRVVDGMLQRFLNITKLTEHQILELEWILIRDLSVLRNQFNRFFFEVTRCQNSFKLRLYDPFDQLNRTMFLIPFHREDIQSHQLLESLHDINCYNGHLKAHILHELEEVPVCFFQFIIGTSGASCEQLIHQYPDILHTDGSTMNISTMVRITLSDLVVKAFGSFGDYARNMIARYPKFIWKYTSKEDRTDLLKRMLDKGTPDNILVLPESINKEDLQFLERIGIIEPGAAEDRVPVAATKFFVNLIKLKAQLGE